jgi:flagellar biosynthesis protein FlhA
MTVLTLDEKVEQIMAQAAQQSEKTGFPNLEPEVLQAIVQNLKGALEKASSLPQQAVVLCSPQIRWHFKRLVGRFVPHIAVVSYNEILSDVKIHSIGRVGLSDAN